MSPEDPSIHYNFAKALMDCGSVEDSIRHHMKAVELMPNNPQPWLNYGEAQSTLGRHKLALELYLGNISRRERNKKNRLGYYSADFHNHAIGYLIAELFELHDRNRFELFGFSFGPARCDGTRKRLVEAFDRFIEVDDFSDLEVAKMSRELAIDIAIDLNGFTRGVRAEIFSYGAAPIQVNYLGYPGTMGASYMDYIIADKTLIPFDFRSHYY